MYIYIYLTRIYLGVFGHFDFQAELAVPVLELRPGARPTASVYALHSGLGIRD